MNENIQLISRQPVLRRVLPVMIISEIVHLGGLDNADLSLFTQRLRTVGELKNISAISQPWYLMEVIGQLHTRFSPEKEPRRPLNSWLLGPKSQF